ARKVHIRAAFNKELRNVEVSVNRGHQKRGALVGASRIQVGSRISERFDGSQPAVASRVHQRRQATARTLLPAILLVSLLLLLLLLRLLVALPLLPTGLWNGFSLPSLSALRLRLRLSARRCRLALILLLTLRLTSTTTTLIERRTGWRLLNVRRQ